MLTLVFLTIFSGVTNAKLANVLRSIDDVITARDLADMTTSPAADFAEIANDASLPLLVRSRAVLALSSYADAANQHQVAAFASDQNPAIRLAATKVLARWASRPELLLAPAILAAMDRSLADEDEAVQLQAVRALSVVNAAAHPSARATLFKAFRATKNELVRDEIARGLTRKRR